MLWILTNYQFSQFWYTVLKQRNIFKIVLRSDISFAPFKLKSLCFTYGRRNREATLGPSEDELHWGFSTAGGREMWLQSSPNLWVCKTFAAGKKIQWSNSAEIFTGWILFCSVMVVTRFSHCPGGKRFLVNVGSISASSTHNEPVINFFSPTGFR